MEEVCEVDHKNCEWNFVVAEYFLAAKFFSSVFPCRTLVTLLHSQMFLWCFYAPEIWTNTLQKLFLVDFYVLNRAKLKMYESILCPLFDLLYCWPKFKMKEIIMHITAWLFFFFMFRSYKNNCFRWYFL